MIGEQEHMIQAPVQTLHLSFPLRKKPALPLYLNSVVISPDKSEIKWNLGERTSWQREA